MPNLTSITLPLGSQSSPKTLTQLQVNTLLRIHDSTQITTKEISGYVFKSMMTRSEYFGLTELGLHVSYDTLIEEQWSVSASPQIIRDGQSSIITLTTLNQANAVITIQSCHVTYGLLSDADARNCFTLSGNVLSFSKGVLTADFMAEVTIAVHPTWNAQDVKTVTISGVSASDIHTVYINPENQSAELVYTGSRSLIEDYVQRCKCYVFNAAGSKMAEIKSATFEGVYDAMTSGTVTFADDTTRNIVDLNNAGCNFMVLRPEMHIFSGKDINDKEILQNTGIYNLLGGKTFPRRYIGMFKAYNQDGILKSQPGRVPISNQSIATYNSLVKEGGAQYCLINYTDFCRENAIHLSYFANTNYEANVGTGRILDVTKTRNIVTGFTLPLIGTYRCGRVAAADADGNDVNCLNFFGLEGVGEQYGERIIGLKRTGNGLVIWEDGTYDSNHPADRSAPAGYSVNTNGYLSKIVAGAEFDVLPKSDGATSSTGYCDAYNNGGSNGIVPYIWCPNGLGRGSGMTCIGYQVEPATIHSTRIAFRGEPQLVNGASLLT